MAPRHTLEAMPYAPRPLQHMRACEHDGLCGEQGNPTVVPRVGWTSDLENQHETLMQITPKLNSNSDEVRAITP